MIIIRQSDPRVYPSHGTGQSKSDSNYDADLIQVHPSHEENRTNLESFPRSVPNYNKDTYPKPSKAPYGLDSVKGKKDQESWIICVKRWKGRQDSSFHSKFSRQKESPTRRAAL
jgi:hypothetical protein